MAHIRKQTCPMKLNPPPARPSAQSTSLRNDNPPPTRPSTQSTSAPSILLQALTMAMISPEDMKEASRPTTTSNSSSPTSRSSTPIPIVSPIVSPISPLLMSPPTKKTIDPSSTSSNFTYLNNLRRKSFQPSKQCSYVFKKGVNKGEQCIKFCFSDETVCNLHSKSKDKTNITLRKHPAVKPKRTRINRLCKYKKYFFVRVIRQTTVMLECEGEHYILTLPRGLVNPIKPTTNDYLIRGRDGVTVWKSL